jgi:hypothetical protein
MSLPDSRVHAVNDTARTRQTAHDYVDRLERRDWPGLAGLLTDDVIYEMPQTRERIRGKDAFLQFNIEYPGDWHLRVRRVVADGRAASTSWSGGDHRPPNGSQGRMSADRATGAPIAVGDRHSHRFLVSLR